MRETAVAGHTTAMIWSGLVVLTLFYLLFWPFSWRLEGRLSLTSGRLEVIIASLLRLRFEADFLQPPFLSLCRLDRRGRRRPIRRQNKGTRSFRPVLQGEQLTAILYLGLREDGAATVELLGAAYGLLETLGHLAFAEIAVRPVPCFDKNICAIRLSGIGRASLAQNMGKYLKGRGK